MEGAAPSSCTLLSYGYCNALYVQSVPTELLLTPGHGALRPPLASRTARRRRCARTRSRSCCSCWRACNTRPAAATAMRRRAAPARLFPACLPVAGCLSVGGLLLHPLVTAQGTSAERFSDFTARRLGELRAAAPLDAWLPLETGAARLPCASWCELAAAAAWRPSTRRCADTAALSAQASGTTRACRRSSAPSSCAARRRQWLSWRSQRSRP